MKTLTTLIVTVGVTLGLTVFLGQSDTLAMSSPSQTTTATNSSPVDQAQLTQMAPYLGYLKAHNDVQSPLMLLGGPLKVSVKQTEGGVHVALPDYRRLDPRVFGTPELPRAFAGTPVMTGAPPDMRQTQNGKYTHLKAKSPFGHANLVLPNGRYSLEALDVTATDAAKTQDTVRMEASWQDDKGNTYSVRCNQPAPHGVEYPSFGGVMTNHILHGSSRIGTPLMPTEFVYVAFWGIGDTLKNGQVLDSGVIVHCMLTEYVRTTDYQLGFDDQVTPTRLQMHLIVPPVGIKDGKFVDRPVKTGFTLSNGDALPFWHVMFSNLQIDARRTQESTTLTSTDATVTDAPRSDRVVVMTDQLVYDPAVVTVPAGTTVQWHNTSSLVHTVTDVPDLAADMSDAQLPNGAQPFNSGNIAPGGTYSHTFEVAGTYRYFCIPHEADGMVGEILVTE